MQEPTTNATCVLRTLTLCDGQVLEQPDHALTVCLCDTRARARRQALDRLVDIVDAQLAEFTSDALSKPF